MGLLSSSLSWFSCGFSRHQSLRGTHLEGAFLWGAHLGGATLGKAHLRGADLRGAHLERAILREAHPLEEASGPWVVSITHYSRRHRHLTDACIPQIREHHREPASCRAHVVDVVTRFDPQCDTLGGGSNGRRPRPS
ncbi:MAG TPA: pentapeptide repeat-containing protein [Gammaproteobacteria bacterium]|nr:pentapeptide repeat-containing protein [Gammaproteobacteria bacterium]